MIYTESHYCNKCEKETDIEIDIEELPDELNQSFVINKTNCKHCNSEIDIIVNFEVWTESK